MTKEGLILECERRLSHGVGVQLVSTTGKQPLPGFRGELLCVNAQGEAVYRFSVRQTERILRLLLSVGDE
jgi:hypothetical protein